MIRTDSSSGRAWVPWETNETPGAFGNHSVSKVGTKGATGVVLVIVFVVFVVRPWRALVSTMGLSTQYILK